MSTYDAVNLSTNSKMEEGVSFVSAHAPPPPTQEVPSNPESTKEERTGALQCNYDCSFTNEEISSA